MSIFCCFMAEYAWRRYNDRPFHKVAFDENAERGIFDRHMKLLIAGICLSTMVIYIRCVPISDVLRAQLICLIQMRIPCHRVRRRLQWLHRAQRGAFQ